MNGRAMPRIMTDSELMDELEPVVDAGLNGHLAATKNWDPHDYVPWSDGRNFAAAGGQDWDPDQSRLSELARVALITNLLTEDNLPSYHRAIAMNFSIDGAWGAWVNRWTAEENRHGIALRDYLVVTRAVDPVALEHARVQQMTAGFSPGRQGQPAVLADTLLDAVCYVTFQELATRVSHRNTGRVCAEPIADQLLKRVASDENLHMLFYRGLTSAALEVAPDQTMESIGHVLANFQMPGYSIPNFRRNAVTIAIGGVYDPRQHLDDVVMPVLRRWRIFERDDVSGEGERRRDELAATIDRMEREAARFEESKARYLARETRRVTRDAITVSRVVG
jgi:acyl-[acyl-carrier-protein] desaturase